MVSRGGTEEARQTAREARLRREKRKKYEALLEEHPAVKALQARRAPERPKAPVKRGIPKLIAEAMQNRDVAIAVTAMRRVMRYHYRAGDLARRRLKRQRIPLKEQIVLIRQGENVERDFQQAVRLSCKAARANPALEAYGTAIASRPDDTEVIDGLPKFLSQSEVAVLTYLGVPAGELLEHWERVWSRHRNGVMGLLGSGKLVEAVAGLEQSVNRLKFPEAPRYLVKRDVITLGGDGSPETSEQVTCAIIVMAGAIMMYTAPIAGQIIGGIWMAVGTNCLYGQVKVAISL